MAEPILLDQTVDFDEDHEGGKQNKLIIKRQQDIPDEFVSQLKRDKIDTLHTPTGDFYRVATIPVALVEQWQREGFDIHKEDARSILARLRKADMDAFITTRKSI